MLSVFAIILLGLSASYSFSSWSKFSESNARLEAKLKIVEARRKNLDAVQRLLNEKQKSARELFESLSRFQKPLSPVYNLEYSQPIKRRVEEFRDLAKSSDFRIENVEPFTFGFEAYKTTIPKPEIAPVLFFELDAMIRLLETLVKSGADSLDGFVREPIPGETDEAESHENPLIHKYPIRIRFRSSRSAFEEFIRWIANDNEHFYQIRVLKFESEETDLVKIRERLDILDVSMVIDIIRFPNPEESK